MIVIPEDEIQYTFSHSSGPGGQNVNKTNTKVMISWNVQKSNVLSEDEKERIIEVFNKVVLQVTSQETRSQQENLKRAIKRLHEMVEDALLESPERLPTNPTYESKIRRIVVKKHRSVIKSYRRKPSLDSDDE
ncbi:MAG: alternative ribosome rescue aminoacyl-tRNA hydrolase ArfB [Caldisericia bacterium]|nr:alternative ribosome rescue aminoacyl-tRNA hydrolase ArfB [Caldisericia bacterium]MDD4615325.1 alternative ribosome rescue aminoacyl-tRNA hydrolase ArfB [Caldisericia bacterium]